MAVVARKVFVRSASVFRSFPVYRSVREVSFTFFEERSGDSISVKAEPGKKVLDIALENNIDIEGLSILFFCHLV